MAKYKPLMYAKRLKIAKQSQIKVYSKEPRDVTLFNNKTRNVRTIPPININNQQLTSK